MIVWRFSLMLALVLLFAPSMALAQKTWRLGILTPGLTPLEAIRTLTLAV